MARARALPNERKSVKLTNVVRSNCSISTTRIPSYIQLSHLPPVDAITVKRPRARVLNDHEELIDFSLMGIRSSPKSEYYWNSSCLFVVFFEYVFHIVKDDLHSRGATFFTGHPGNIHLCWW